MVNIQKFTRLPKSARFNISTRMCVCVCGIFFITNRRRKSPPRGGRFVTGRRIGKFDLRARTFCALSEKTDRFYRLNEMKKFTCYQTKWLANQKRIIRYDVSSSIFTRKWKRFSKRICMHVLRPFHVYLSDMKFRLLFFDNKLLTICPFSYVILSNLILD